MQSLRTPAQSLFGAATRSRNYSIPARLPLTSTAARSLSTVVRPLADRAPFRPNKLTTNPSPNRSFHSSTANMSVTVIKSKKEFTEALNAEGLMVLDCFATWCGPCKMIAPKIEEFAKTYDKARFYKIDVDEVPDVAQELSIRAMPTICFFKGGEKLDDVVGANPPAIEAQIKAGLA